MSKKTSLSLTPRLTGAKNIGSLVQIIALLPLSSWGEWVEYKTG
jgi:hypothetical protein